MELIEKLGTRRSNYGKMVRWGKYKCSFCLKIVERTIKQGERDKSCGCNQYEFIKKNKISLKHGGCGTRLYNIWRDIKQRILNPNNPDYKYYGGRGITICPEWAESYIVFRDWSLSHGYKEGLEIHRENDGNYEPSSCKWVTRTENLRDTRRNVIKNIEMANEIRDLYATGNYTQKELAKIYNVDQTIISKIILNKLWKND